MSEAEVPTATTERDIYEWTGQESDCPKDIVVNAGNRPIIIAAQGVPEVARDQPRIDVGDRRQGSYYIKQIGQAVSVGLAKLHTLPIERVRQLEKTRQVREGLRPADWILKARARADQGEGPPVLEDKHSAMTALQRAATVTPGAHGHGEL